jgi:Uma2 family endonuclease
MGTGCTGRRAFARGGLAAAPPRRYHEPMSAAAAPKNRRSVEEYLEMERQALDKHELFDGEIFLMAGASPEHNQIAANLIHALLGALGEKCIVYSSDMRLFIPATGLYTYADASLVCGRPDFTDDSPKALRSPEAIFEVLSDSTESYDRGKKFESYRSVPALSDYVLLAQDRILVEHFTRHSEGAWLLRELRAGGRLRLPCGEIAVDDLYRRVLPTG